jgi:type II secretory pathway component GspD/PulD (secretin)
VVQTFYPLALGCGGGPANLNNILNVPGRRPAADDHPNKTANSVIARATSTMMPIIERLVQLQDTPRAEVLIDVRSSRSARRGRGNSA